MEKRFMNINLKWIFIFICFLCFLSLSNVFAVEDNSTDLLQEDCVDEPILTENNTNLNDIDTYLNSSDVFMYYKGPERYGVYLYDFENNPLINKTINFTVNGVTYNRYTNDEGYASIGINLNSGNYSINCFFNGDDYYKPCNCSNWIFVNSTIFADDLVKYFRNSSQYYSLFFSVNGTPLVNTTVTFNINGVFYNRSTNSSGWARLNINLDPGEYIITAYNPVSSEMHSNNITVLPILIAEDLYMDYRDGSCFEVIVLDDTGNPYPNQTVTFNINGVFYNRISDLYGVARLNINLMTGEYIITSYFNNAAIANNITVGQSHFPNSYSLIANNCDFYYGGDNIFEVRLIDNYGNFIPNKSILLECNGYSLARLTDEYGYAKWLIDWNVDSYDVYLSFRSNYPNDIINNTFKHINVYKSTTFLSNASSLVINYSNYIKYSVKLTNQFNNPVSGKNISFEILNHTYHNTTDQNGMACYYFNLDVGDYNISTNFNADSNYYSSCLENTLSIVAYIMDVYIDKNNDYYNNSSLNITISSNILDSFVFYSFDNETWFNNKNSISLVLPRGNWDLYYYSSYLIFNSSIKHSFFKINNMVPIVFSNYPSDVYSSPIFVNLSFFDYCDDNITIYYTLNESDPNENSLIFNNSIIIESNTCLKFYGVNSFGLSSNISSVNYLFGQIANLNSGKTFNTIQEAIDDNITNDGDVIRVNGGSYFGGVNISKAIKLSGKNYPIILFNGNEKCFDVNSGNVCIEGFKFQRNLIGIYLANISNCIIRDNIFIQSYASIVVNNSHNCIIHNNSIIRNGYNIPVAENITRGIVILNSSSLLIYNNFINFNSSILSNFSCIGIDFNHLPSSNIFIFNNTIIGNIQYYGMNIVGFNLSIYDNTISGFYYAIYSQLVNSEVYYNNILNSYIGLYFNSINSSFHSNNIWNNHLGVIQNRTLNSSFYLNRVSNKHYNFHSDSYDLIDVSDNWWGINNFTDKSDVNVSYKNNVILNSYIVLKFSINDYFVEDNIIKKVRLNVDMNFNNLNQDLSTKGHLMDDIDVIFFIHGLDNIFLFSKLNNGYASVLVDLNELYDGGEVLLSALLDDAFKSILFNKNEPIYYSIFSTAINANGDNIFLEDNFTFSNVSWFTVAWCETGIYSGMINIIVNGGIVKSINITNKYYLQYKNFYGDNVFEAMLEFNNVFASTKEKVFSPNNLLFELKNNNYVTNMDDSNNTKLEALNNYFVPTYSLSDVEKDFIFENHKNFVDKVAMFINYGASYTPNIIFNDSKLAFPSGIIYRVSNIYYSNIMANNGSIGYEGMRSFALATSKVSQEVLSYWLNKSNNYEPGMMKAAYGTFLTDLIVMYEHDCVADLAAEAFNVSWYRSSPAAFSLCNDYNCLYITGESNHDMGMSVNGSDNDVWKFRFTCSFAYSLIEQLVGSNIWQDYTIGSVTLGLLQSYMNNKSLELRYENGYYFLKVVGEDYSLLVLDPVTGIVRDILSFNGLLGTMPCYHDGITDNAIRYGNSLLIINSSELSQFNFLYIVSSCFSIIGSSLIVESGIVSSSIIVPIGLLAIGILVGFQLISPFLAEISRNNSLYSIADFYDLDLLGKIEAYIDYYFFQDGIIMDGINEFNTDFYIENYKQIELNKKQTEDIIKNAQKIANKLFIPFQIVMASSSGGSKPDKSFYILSIITVYGVFSYYTFQLIETSIIAKQKYLFKPYDFNQPYANKDSMIINQTVLEVN